MGHDPDSGGGMRRRELDASFGLAPLFSTGQLRAFLTACLQNHHSERKAHRKNRAVVVLVEGRHRDLHTTADADMESLR
jgi:hypothetical protein